MIRSFERKGKEVVYGTFHHPARHEKGFADTINRVAYGNERVVLRRRGKEVAAAVPIADLRLLEELEDRMDLVDARAALAETKEERREVP